MNLASAALEPNQDSSVTRGDADAHLNTHFSALLHRREAEMRQRVEAEWDAWQKQQAMCSPRWCFYDDSRDAKWATAAQLPKGGTDMICALAASIGARAAPVFSARTSNDHSREVGVTSLTSHAAATVGTSHSVSVAERIARLSARRSVLSRSPAVADQQMSPSSRPPSTASQLSADVSSQPGGRSSSGGGDAGSDEGSVSRSASSSTTAAAHLSSSRVESFRKLVRMSPEQQTAKLLTRVERDLPLVASRANHTKGTTTAPSVVTKAPPLRR